MKTLERRACGWAKETDQTGTPSFEEKYLPSWPLPGEGGQQQIARELSIFQVMQLLCPWGLLSSFPLASLMTHLFLTPSVHSSLSEAEKDSHHYGSSV